MPAAKRARSGSNIPRLPGPVANKVVDALLGKKRYRRRRSSSRPRRLRRSRTRVPVALMPESKYIDGAYLLTASTPTHISLGAGAQVLDFNGPASSAIAAAAGYNPGGGYAGGITNGAGFNQRIGRKILIKYMALRMRVLPAVTDGKFPVISSTVPMFQFRVMLFWDKQPNLALPIAADVININPGLSTLALLEDKNRDRFQRLWDHTDFLTATTPENFNDNSMKIINKTIRINGQQIYNDTALGTVANIQSGSLFMLIMGDPLWVSNNPIVEMSYRLRFDDL